MLLMALLLENNKTRRLKFRQEEQRVNRQIVFHFIFTRQLANKVDWFEQEEEASMNF